MKFINHLIVALALFVSSTGVQAEIQLTRSPDRPSEAVVLSYEPAEGVGNTTAFYRGSGGFRSVGQSFAVTERSVEMSGFTWKLWKSDPEVSGKKFSVKIYRLSAINEPPQIGEDSIWSEQGTLPQTLNPGEYLTFTFAKPVTLNEGDSYLLLFSFEEATSADASAKSVGFERSETNASFGRLWTFNGEIFAADNKAMTLLILGK